MYWAVDTPVQAAIAAVEDPQVYNLPMAGDRWRWTSLVGSDPTHWAVDCPILAAMTGLIDLQVYSLLFMNQSWEAIIERHLPRLC